MSTAVQITLIICATIIILSIISSINIEYRSDNTGGRCKSPTHPAPPIPGTSSADSLRSIKPPSAESGTKDTSKLDETFGRR